MKIPKAIRTIGRGVGALWDLMFGPGGLVYPMLGAFLVSVCIGAALHHYDGDIRHLMTDPRTLAPVCIVSMLWLIQMQLTAWFIRKGGKR